jgi:hypothetical protein
MWMPICPMPMNPAFMSYTSKFGSNPAHDALKPARISLVTSGLMVLNIGKRLNSLPVLSLLSCINFQVR